MSAASGLSTLDGKNRNPIVANTSANKRKDFEYLRRQ